MTQPPPLPANPIEELRKSSGTVRGSRVSRILFGAISAAWKLGFATLLSQSLVLSVLVVGWTARAMQRAVYRQWWKTSEARRSGMLFSEIVEANDESRQNGDWPNFILAQSLNGRRLGSGWRKGAGSLVENAIRGAQMSDVASVRHDAVLMDLRMEQLFL
jgi:hypothetical protein